MKLIEKSIEFGGRKLTLTIGKVAQQADGAVLARYGDTTVLATIVASDLEKEVDYFPLTVDYQERFYAGGRIKGSKWVKREGKPTDEEILSGRLIDRSLRPLFPKSYKKDVQIVVTVLSVDLENDPAVLAGVAASAATAISSVPWKGPVAIVRVGLKDEKFIINPTTSELEESLLDLVVSSTKDAIIMIEAGAKEVADDKVLKAIEFAQAESQKIISLIEEISAEAGTKKEAFEEPEYPASLVKKVKELVGDRLESMIAELATHEGGAKEYEELLAAVADHFEDEKEKKLAVEVVHKLERDFVRDLALKGKRVDGRKLNEIRKLSAEVAVLPRVHGSALFSRGQTQALSVATIGAPSLEQILESAEGEESKKYMHHYSMPPFATGETGRVGQPSRREIGHGALAERALAPVIPSQDEFPYAIRVVTEIMSSNGSTSMASVCGSTLSLMDAGVPIKNPVAGIAMGLVIESDKKFAILSDILGIEDFKGDMDFKVAGSKYGITALQLDVKTLKLTTDILKKALEQALEGRLYILDFMLNNAIDKPRESVSKYAPKIKWVQIPIERVGELIGPGGRTIKGLIAETGTDIDVDEKGRVYISSTDAEVAAKVANRISMMMKDPQKGEIYEGEVKRIQPFGVFVEILPGKEGLVHISDMSTDFVRNPEDLVGVGQKVTVRVKEIDELGRVNLSMVLDPAYDDTKGPRKNRDEAAGEAKEVTAHGRSDTSFARDRGRFSRERKQSFGFGYRGRDKRGGRGGPHFPTSRLMDDPNNNFGK